MKKSKLIGTKDFYHRVLMVAVPIMIQNGITNFVGMLDNIMVGQVGTDQMSGVAIVNQLMFVYNLMVFGGLAGIGIFTAQFAGKGDEKGLRYTMRIKIVMALVLTAGATILFFNVAEGRQRGRRCCGHHGGCGGISAGYVGRNGSLCRNAGALRNTARDGRDDCADEGRRGCRSCQPRRKLYPDLRKIRSSRTRSCRRGNCNQHLKIRGISVRARVAFPASGEEPLHGRTVPGLLCAGGSDTSYCHKGVPAPSE